MKTNTVQGIERWILRGSLDTLDGHDLIQNTKYTKTQIQIQISIKQSTSNIIQRCMLRGSLDTADEQVEWQFSQISRSKRVPPPFSLSSIFDSKRSKYLSDYGLCL